MGPRSIDRGNRGRLRGIGRLINASMGPRSIDRGNTLRHLGIGKPTEASMGPRSIDRGNVSSHPVVRFTEMLQWGRDLLIAETSSRASENACRDTSFNGAAIY